jgi:two-component system response regulator HydG
VVGVDARVIAATNRDLERAMSRLEFREDLYYRLNVVELRIPPLRERREEIPALAAWFLDRFNAQYGRQKRLSPETLALLSEHPWRGNVRELENTLRRMVVLADGEQEFATLVANGRGRCGPLSPVGEGLREIGRRAAREAERLALAESSSACAAIAWRRRGS